MTYFDPGTFRIQSAGKPWSYQTDGNEMRFEVRSGDRWQGDRSNVERSEIASYKHLEFDQTYSISYKIMIEPGARNTAKWLVIGQLHATEDPQDSGVSPPFGIDLIGERMKIDARWSTAEQTNWGNVTTRELYADKTDIQRGHWYDIKVTVKFDPFGNGALDLWRDGVQLIDYNGPLGYNDEIGPYWKHGVYREPASETFAANYSDFSLVQGTVDPDPIGIINGTAGNDVLHGTAAQDSIYGGDGFDNLYGEAGNDFLNGQAGSDILDGGAGNDVLHGLVGNDYLFGGDGNDRIVTGTGSNFLSGGNGADVFDFNDPDEQSLNISIIVDFAHGVDKIDLFDMDANVNASGDQQFSFIAQNGFSGKAGELRYSGEVLSADVNGDKIADFQVRTPHATITAGDVIL